MERKFFLELVEIVKTLLPRIRNKRGKITVFVLWHFLYFKRKIFLGIVDTYWKIWVYGIFIDAIIKKLKKFQVINCKKKLYDYKNSQRKGLQGNQNRIQLAPVSIGGSRRIVDDAEGRKSSKITSSEKLYPF